MEQIVYSANLSATQFPLISDQIGRTIIISGQDNMYIPQESPTSVDSLKRGIPQILYGHNIIPTSKGWQSIGYKQMIPALGPTKNFRRMWPVYNEGSLIRYIAQDINDKNFYRYDTGTNSWVIVTVAGSSKVNPTFAYINGKTYMLNWPFDTLFASQCFVYDTITETFLLVALTAVNMTGLRGIFASSGYMLAWNNNTIVWSSLLDPTDFAPSLITGAGGGKIQEAKGQIHYCKAVPNGFLIFTESNVVSATYSGNARYPFIFKEIQTGNGMDISFVPNFFVEALLTKGASNDTAEVFDKSGLQTLSLSGAKIEFPDITDFIESKRGEDFDDNTLQFTYVNKSQIFGGNFRPNGKKITNIANRYMVISYNALADAFVQDVTNFTHALILDLATGRLGKLKITHTWCHEYLQQKTATALGQETPRDSIGFLQADGTFLVVDFDLLAANSVGILFLGRFQYIRTRMLEVQEVAVGNIHQQAAFTVYNFPSLDGENDSGVQVEYVADNTGLQRVSTFRSPGLNHRILFKGAFDMNSAVLKFKVSGKR